jgi:hypothetical protein
VNVATLAEARGKNKATQNRDIGMTMNFIIGPNFRFEDPIISYGW